MPPHRRPATAYSETIRILLYDPGPEAKVQATQRKYQSNTITMGAASVTSMEATFPQRIVDDTIKPAVVSEAEVRFAPSFPQRANDVT
ncbi:hypothetical protein H310_15009 [Aphanomyces invadans]|uniref:Uncharacterized protein n=1 Tax=Aphanomyces invadans TaxID=157072 RepID=A0A024T890_9STRA|nr:hypothetical protein H310_15009 [Aphanomyces invadans]ETV90159.1 hypothetical protein H310_15009 [Aphanomyces invadans]|eukprot:XP_008881211.1 hypothetical protein H310_15009 [Aphanomyces invadans]